VKGMQIEKKFFGTIPEKLPERMVHGKYEGREIYNYILKNDHDMTVEISEYGAVIVKILVPDKNGHVDDIQLGYDNLWGYICNTECFGALVGRSANRIANHSFTLNGETYILENNDNGTNLHGSVLDNYFRRPWDFVETKEGADFVSVKLHLFSPDGDQGFPGNLDVYITYTLKQDGSLCMDYAAHSDKDTVLNLTNHSYMNLGGHASGCALDATVWIDSTQVTHNRPGNIPTGRILDIQGGALDFSIPKPLKQDFKANDYMLKNAKGYDFNYILKNQGKLQLVAYMKHATNGRKLSVYTDLPGLQLYTGNFLGKGGKDGRYYKDYDGVCFESQQFPDAIHHENFPSNVLKAGEDYESHTVFQFTVEE
jgi:aldose 1-epimerase